LKNTVLEASYIGNHGLHLWRRGVAYNDVVPSARLAIAEGIRNGTDVTALTNDNRIHKGLGPITGSEASADSRYNALQFWLNRRFTNRLSFQASYTWSHSITNVPLASFTSANSDPFNYDLDRGDADLDRRHMFVANAVYVLPSFQRWGSFARHVIGDWQLNTIVSFLSGTPIDVITGQNNAGLATTPSAGLRPDLVPGVDPYLHTGDPLRFLNPAAFALPAAGKFWAPGPGALPAPGINKVDFSVEKNWRLKESSGIKFRAEMFNVFNHPNFIGVDNNLALDNNIHDANFGQPTNSNFGRLGGDRGPREIQFGLKFSF